MMLTPTFQKVTRWLAIAWTVAILAGMSIPGDGMPDLGNSRDKWVHCFAFFGIAILWRLAGWSWRRTLLFGVGYAIGTEIYQAIMPIGRSGDWQDALADTTGLCLGLLVTATIKSGKSYKGVQ
ncbi:VanZ family protein [Fibrella aquatilis]|uniref:VanZ family protein n=1 Tax=Fibrella aquatilis TaxID=2817059 RepID=A0A939K1Y2_9BACT|nr:VanZ family protein [Fibrella aquatilis]MBO0933536.1 VanZ family protein [Fibrella aquatilis]